MSSVGIRTEIQTCSVAASNGPVPGSIFGIKRNLKLLYWASGAVRADRNDRMCMGVGWCSPPWGMTIYVLPP